MKSLVLLLVALIFSAQVKANDRVAGNGGDGIVLGNKLYLLDLVEEGVEADPLFPKTNKCHPTLAKIVDRSLTRINLDKELLKGKLQQVFEINKTFALSIAEVIRSYNWVLVNSALVDVPDEDSVIDYGGNPLVQIAIRRDHSIRISRDAWAGLDEKQKTAVILHEAIYAMNVPLSSGEIDGVATYAQSSPKSRELNGFLFSPVLLEKGNDGIVVIGGDYFPVHSAPKGKFKVIEDPSMVSLLSNPKIKLSLENGKMYVPDSVYPKNATDVENYISTNCSETALAGVTTLTLHGIVRAEPLNLAFDNYFSSLKVNQTYFSFSENASSDYSNWPKSLKDTQINPSTCSAGVWEAYKNAQATIAKDFQD